MSYVKALIISFISIFVPVVPILLLVGLFIFSDTILGILAAKKQKQKITSRKLGHIIPKMILYQMAVLTAFLLDVYLLGEFLSYFFQIQLIFTKLVAVSLIFIELVSMDEKFKILIGKTIIESFRDLIKLIKREKKSIEEI